MRPHPISGGRAYSPTSYQTEEAGNRSPSLPPAPQPSASTETPETEAPPRPHRLQLAHSPTRNADEVSADIRTYEYPTPQMIKELSEYAMREGSEFRYAQLPSFYGSAARIVQAALNEKLPPGWEKICILAATEVVEEDGEKMDAPWPGQTIFTNRKAYVLVNLEENEKELDLNGAARAIKLLGHEIQGHGTSGLRALSRGEEPDSEEEQHLPMIRPLDGREGENSYLATIRKVLPYVNVQNFPGLREKILEEYRGQIPDDVPNFVLDRMLKQTYLHLCINDIEQQVIDHAGSDEDMESVEDMEEVEADPAVAARCEELVEPLRKVEQDPDHPVWTSQAGNNH